MGGNVRVESEGEGHGTQFIIQLSAFSSVKQSDLKIQVEENVLDEEQQERLNNVLNNNQIQINDDISDKSERII